jgi:hypothetical protein
MLHKAGWSNVTAIRYMHPRFVDSTGAVPLLAPLPALLVAFLFTLAAVLRSPFLRLAGLLLGVLYTPASVMLSLLSTFS